jgi:hypothetical protein
MKNFTLIALLIFLLSASFCFSQKGIGTNTPSNVAVLELKSTTKGFLLPRLTKAQRNAITPVEGLVVYCTDCVLQGVQVYNGTIWQAFKNLSNNNGLTSNSGLVYNEVVSPDTDRIWLDRNLGATQLATSKTDADSYGGLYQWGRNTDGHQLKTSITTTTTATSGEPNSNQFILASGAIHNNWTDYAGENDLWQGEVNDNNPCPSGFRLPTETEFLDEVGFFGGTPTAANAYQSFLGLPSSGVRTTDGVIITTQSRYWTSTINAASSRGVYIGAASITTQNYSRSLGAAVRCIKEL